MRVDAPRSALAVAIAAVLVLAGCGSSGDPARTSQAPKTPASAAPKSGGAKVTPAPTAGGVVLTRDPEEDNSFPLPAGTRGAKQAPLPVDAPAAPRRTASKGSGSEISPGAPRNFRISAIGKF